MSIISSGSYRLVQALPLSYFLLHVRLDRPSTMYDWTKPYAIASALVLIVSALLMLKRKIYSPAFVGINVYFLFGGVALAAHWDAINLLYGKLEGAGMMVWIVAVVAIGNCIQPQWSLELTQDQITEVKTNAHWRGHAWLLFGFCVLCTGLTLFIMNNTTSVLLREFAPFIILFTGAALIKRNSLKLTTTEQT